MKKNLLLPLFILTSLISVECNAQKVFLDGYIIKNDGTVLYGYIEYLKNDCTPEECRFKWFEISESKTIKPGEIKTFGFLNGKRYDSKEIGGKNVFIECLVNGEIGLFFDGKKMYVEDSNIKLTPLEKGATEIEKAGEKVKADGYKDLLSMMGNENGTIKVSPSLSLDKQSVLKLIRDYDMNYPGCTIYSATTQTMLYSDYANSGGLSIRYGVTGGINASMYDAKIISGESIPFPEMDSYEITPVAGVFFEKRLSRVKDIISLRTELLLFKSNIYVFNSESNILGTTRSDYFIKLNGVKIPLYLQIGLRDKKFCPYLIEGGFVNFYSGDYTRKWEYENSLNEVRQYEESPAGIRNTEYGLLSGVGFRYKINIKNYVYLQCSYQSGKGIYDVENEKQSSKSISIVAAYCF